MLKVCQGCTDRYLGCHDKCSKRAAELLVYMAAKENERLKGEREKIFDDYKMSKKKYNKPKKRF